MFILFTSEHNLVYRVYIESTLCCHKKICFIDANKISNIMKMYILIITKLPKFLHEKSRNSKYTIFAY